jgi:serine/threonine-protein phosphatase 6 regulatory ankyrin repeat subunit B
MIIKASKLTKAARVYRGISGGVLPESFWKPNEQGVRGGVERAFVSTSHKRSEAMRYATTDDRASMLFEMQMGMTDRGCDVSGISQYPREEECLFAPLTGFELMHTRVEGRVLVVEVRLSVNLNALTLEQVINKLKRSQLDLIKVIRDDLARRDDRGAALARLDSLRAQLRAREGSWFNDAANYKASITRVFEARDADSVPPKRAAKQALAEPSHVSKARRARQAVVDLAQSPRADTAWTADAWLVSTGATADIVKALHKAANVRRSSDELAMTRSLSELGEAELARRLREADLPGCLAKTLYHELRELRANDTASELRVKHSKFVDEKLAFELEYADLSVFFGGLEAQIGPPEPQVLQAMEREHAGAEDSRDDFTAPNYGITTTPETEWWFVKQPSRQPSWPEETLRIAESPDKKRTPMSQSELDTALRRVNERLRKLGEAELIIPEGYGARLYTGPMCAAPPPPPPLTPPSLPTLTAHRTRTGMCRSQTPLPHGQVRQIQRHAARVRRLLRWMQGHRYVTTIHAINSAIVKASKLTKVERVYRGIKGGALPTAFWTPNAQGVRGGVERSFLSFSYDRAEALRYATDDEKPSIVFEIQMGAVDRGCNLEWISQYKHERECLFPPLMGMELLQTRVEGRVLIAEVRPSVNLRALTLEQVINKMQQSHLALVQLFLDVFAHNHVPDDVCAPLLQLKQQLDVFAHNHVPDHFRAPLQLNQQPEVRDGAWFNDSKNFEKATAEVFAARDAVFGALISRPDTWSGAVHTATMCAREGRQDSAIAVLKRADLGLDERDDDCRLARWMVKEQLAYPWPATFAELDKPELVDLLTDELIERDRLRSGSSVLAYQGNTWQKAVVTRVHHGGEAIDVKVRGWWGIKDLPCTEALVMDFGGAGALVRAASGTGSAALVERLIAKGVSPLVADNKANTPLHLAASGGHADVCRALLGAGADQNAYNVQLQSALELAQTSCRHGVVRIFTPTFSDQAFAARGSQDFTMLMLACRSKDLSQAEERVRAGEDVNARSESGGFTALHLAAEEGDDRIVKMLLKHGAHSDIPDTAELTPLMQTCRYGHELCARALIEAMANVEATVGTGHTALMLASQNGHELCARALIEAGANVNHASNDGRTALIQASKNGHELCARTLIEAGANVNYAANDGWTALMFASRNGHELCACTLIEAGADVNNASHAGWTALMFASQNGHELCARALIEAGANVNHAGKSGLTALMSASQNGHELCAQALIEAGANPNLLSKNGGTALMAACGGGHVECALALIQGGADLDASAKDGRTALMAACIGGHETCARALIAARADVDKRSIVGYTALRLARRYGHVGCRELLEDAGANAGCTIL